MSIIYLSHNLIEVIEKDTFLGLNLSILDLSFNRIEVVPTAALRAALFIESICLDGLEADDLIPGSLEVRLTFFYFCY